MDPQTKFAAALANYQSSEARKLIIDMAVNLLRRGVPARPLADAIHRRGLQLQGATVLAAPTAFEQKILTTLSLVEAFWTERNLPPARLGIVMGECASTVRDLPSLS